ncbi:MAG: tRNA epoxyqueuosine(34) reductase QueG [Gemmataceae bacterium]
MARGDEHCALNGADVPRRQIEPRTVPASGAPSRIPAQTEGTASPCARSLETDLADQARQLGFDLVGIASASAPPGWPRLQAWLAAGYAAQMKYMHHPARADPRAVFAEVRSIVVVAISYKPAGHEQTQGAVPEGAEPARPHGRVARYAQGLDYHRVLKSKLHQLLDWLKERRPETQGRAVVDSAPLMERDYARLAGLGWFGKNTMLINKRLGSYLLLGALLVNLELQPTGAVETDHCGTCTRCLEACPTGALLAPGVLDSGRCISYLTIELRGPVPEPWRGALHQWVFGCDICQEVCPWNRKAPAGKEPALQPRPELTSLDLLELLDMSDADFRRRFGPTALERARRRGLVRNAAYVLGTLQCSEAIPALRRLQEDDDPVVRDAAGWALARIAANTATVTS